jgi:hypothetical protein
VQRAVLQQAIAFALLSGLQSGAVADMIYFVEPVTLADDYSVTGGFIVTNGTLGSLADSDILNYEFVVTGPQAYTFSPVNPGAFLGGNMIATAKQIILPLDTDPSPRAYTGLSVLARDNEPSQCEDCIQQLSYASMYSEPPLQSNRSEVQYTFTDATDFAPAAGVQVTYFPQAVLTIATVPEPGSIHLAMILSCVFIAMLTMSCKRTRHPSTVA